MLAVIGKERGEAGREGGSVYSVVSTQTNTLRRRCWFGTRKKIYRTILLAGNVSVIGTERVVVEAAAAELASFRAA